MSSNIRPPIQLSTGTNESPECYTLIRRQDLPERRHRQGTRVYRWREEPYVIVVAGKKEKERASRQVQIPRLLLGDRLLPSAGSMS